VERKPASICVIKLVVASEIDREIFLCTVREKLEILLECECKKLVENCLR